MSDRLSSAIYIAVADPYRVHMRGGHRGVPGVLREPLIVDTALAAFVTVIAVAQQTSSVAATAGTRSLGMTFAAVISLPLVLRRRAPLTVLGVMLVGVAAWSMVVPATTGAGIPLMVALYTVAAHRTRAWSLGAAFLAALFILGVQNQASAVTSNVVEVVASCAAAWWLGNNSRIRRAQSEALSSYVHELAITREQLAEQRVAEERLRIAREMHDVVAHSLGVVAVQAGVAEHLLSEDPSQARTSISTMGDVARTGLTDMRRTLGLLRNGDEPFDRESAPRLGQVPALVDSIRAASRLDVQLRMEGSPANPLDPAMELTIYRVIQEALTNVSKHAPGSHVLVRLHFGNDAVNVEITDGGSDRSLHLPGSGNGLLGMQERVGMFGGTLEADRRADGGFRVAARIPIAGELP